MSAGRYGVFLALLVGTALTVAVAFVDLGAMDNVLMLGIAMTKARLVRLTWLVVASGFLWLLSSSSGSR